ncbi:MAG: aminotransferase class I/II-fold pyridoxal phosphate-dependent enzyme, partial [Thermoflexales bacterium]|nr:aminotransferase class I/II-fold pyridoxal phosphate-dependent enzyme [Thermoflexales bacterium]
MRTSAITNQFTESVIREMTRVANAHGAVNLSQGFPDWPAPMEVKEAAARAIMADVNQYAITYGAKPLRMAIADLYRNRYEMQVNPETDICVCCGAT